MRRERPGSANLRGNSVFAETSARAGQPQSCPPFSPGGLDCAVACPDGLYPSVVSRACQPWVSAVAYPATGGGNSPLTSTVRSAIRLYIREQTLQLSADPVDQHFSASLPERTCEKAVTGDDPGLLMGEFDGATQAHGPATTRGLNSDTGMARLG